MSEFKKTKKLIEEIRKPGRQLLYDLRDVNYKNTKLKQIVWQEISEALGVDKNGVQGLWKRTKVKYKTALAKENAPSDSAPRKMKSCDTFLIKEMRFLQPFIEDNDSTSSATKKQRSTTEPSLFGTLERLEKLTESIMQAPIRDKFYDFIEQEIERQPQAKKEHIKKEIMKLIYS